MSTPSYDIIVIGAGSGGLSVSLFMQQAGFKTLLIDRSDEHIGGDCLNDGCVPSKALIHVAKIVHQTRQGSKFGLNITGDVDAKRVAEYVFNSQQTIRHHENAAYFRKMGLDVALGEASFSAKDSVIVNNVKYTGRNIIIATGSRPIKLVLPGVELVKYYDNESIFDLEQLPKRFLIVGGGPIGSEIGQALARLGCEVTIIQKSDRLLKNDDPAVVEILEERLKQEGIQIFLNSSIVGFSTANLAIVEIEGIKREISFDAIFVAAGRESKIESLALDKAGIKTENGKIRSDSHLRTTNKNVYVCGDVVGDLKFSHAAEYHARVILNNLFSPFKKKVSNDHLSWVTFTDPEVATFGLSESELKKRGVQFNKLESRFDEDDRAVVDDHRYAKLILYVTKKGLLTKQKILGGTMVAPNAGELIQELILANTQGLSIDAIFDKIYPYPVASRINQKLIVDLKSKSLTPTIKGLLRVAYKVFS